MEDCIFCKIVKGTIPSFKVYEDERVLAFEDINPIQYGHTLVIPKRHAENLWEMTDEDIAAVHRASKRIGMAVKKALGATGLACLQLNEKGANQVVMHYHLHIIPRLPDGPPLPVSNWELKTGDMARVKETADRIRAALG
jgi:histidine triad (HIT) family protein